MASYLVRIEPNYAPVIAFVRIVVPAGPQAERRAAECACIVTRLSLARHGLIPKETS